MSQIQVLLFVHILGAFMIASGVGLGEVVVAGVRRSRSTTAILTLLHAGSRIPMMTIPGGIIAIVFGTWLAAVTGRSFGEAWLSAAYLAWVLSIVISVAILGPAERRLMALAQAELAAGREESPALIEAAQAPRMAIASHTLAAMLLLFLVLMVFKPGA